MIHILIATWLFLLWCRPDKTSCARCETHASAYSGHLQDWAEKVLGYSWAL